MLRVAGGLVLLALMAQMLLKADVVTIDFETFPGGVPIVNGTSITTQFPGVTFTNATVLSAGIGLNEFETPPHSGQNAAFDDGGPISISFASPILSFGAYFTYYEPPTLAAFDSMSNEVATAASAFSINVGCDPGPICFGDPGSTPERILAGKLAGGYSKRDHHRRPGG